MRSRSGAISRTARSAARTQRRAAEGGGGQEPRGQGADERAQQVRHHEADEADRARDRDPGADGERGAGDGEGAGAAERHAHRGGGILAEGQRVERAAEGQQQRAMPARMKGAASATWTSERSASEPSSQ